LFAAVALVAYLVQPGDTLSGIAASHGASLAAVEAANPKLADFNLIYTGESVDLPEGSSATQGASATQGSSAAQGASATVGSSATQGSSAAQGSTAQASGSQGTSSSHRSPSSIASTATRASSTGSSAASSSSSGYSSSGSLSDIPGVPSSFASCVAYRESTNLQNPAADGNAYGIIPASGHDVYGSSLASQKQVFAELYQQYGTSPWASDGC
jgi:hypothetical protein